MPTKTIYAFDIETSDFQNTTDWCCHADDNRVAFMHQFTVSKMNLWEDTEPTHVLWGTKVNQFRDFLIELFETGTNQYISAHNLSFEFHWLIGYPWFQEWLRNGSMLMAETRKPISLELKRTPEDTNVIKVLDTKLITGGQSIARLGDELHFPKLTYDYKAFIFPWEHEFTEEEIEYCYRDNDIALMALAKKVSAYSWIKDMSDVPVTSTGFIRKELVKNTEINKVTKTRKRRKKVGRTFKKTLSDGTVKEYTRKTDNHVEIINITAFDEWSDLCKDVYITDPIQLSMFNQAFNGGFTHANPYYSGQVMEDCIHVDFRSSYPAVLLNKAGYPLGKFEEVTDKNVQNSYISEIRKLADKPVTKLAGTAKYGKYPWIATVKLTDVEIKQFGKNVFPMISGSKAEDRRYLTNSLEDNTCYHFTENGKLYQARTVIYTMTNVDLLTYLLTYNVNKIEVMKMWRTKKQGYAPAEIVNAINYFATEKQEWKKVVKAIENHKEIPEVNVDRDKLNLVLNCDDHLEKLATANNYLQQAKNSLNGLYGQQVQRQVQDEYTLNENGVVEKRKMSIEECKPKKYSRYNHSFAFGEYVTSYARLNLTLFNLMCIDTGAEWIYSDTDSSFFSVTEESRKKVDEVVNIWNTICVNKERNKFDLGIMEFEPHCDKFVTLGAKRYMLVHDGEIDMKVSGLNADNGIRCYQTWYDNFYDKDFDRMVHDIFHHNVEFDSDITGKLCSSYNVTGMALYEQYSFNKEIDEKMKEYDIRGCTSLFPASYSMSDMQNSQSAVDYMTVLDRVFNNPQNFADGSMYDTGNAYWYVDNDENAIINYKICLKRGA